MRRLRSGRSHLVLSALGMVLLGTPAPVAAQSGGPYTLTWNTIDGGGATVSTGGDYALGGTAGQADAGSASGAGIAWRGGFWAGVVMTPGCVGDCGGNQQVTVDEILTLVLIAVGNATVATCPAGDANQDGQITVEEILAAVHQALTGCGGGTASASAQAGDAGLPARGQ